MNPHSTYANLSDEERAGLDARESARERLLAAHHRLLKARHDQAHSGEVVSWPWAECPICRPELTEQRSNADAIEAEAVERYRAGMKRATREAVAAERVGLAEAVRALHNDWLGARWNEAIDACAALLQDTSTPSKAEPSGGMG